jgi:rod shape-determining protein MreC
LKNLINFILKNAHWLLFFSLIFLSVSLLVHSNDFQRSKYLTVFQEVAGRVYSVSNGVESYMNLKTTNDDLVRRVAQLEQKIQVYQNKLEALSGLERSHEILFGPDPAIAYHYIPARVVHNQISGMENYITLNKGSVHGVKKDMSVLSSTGGIAGVIMNVTPHFSIAISVLNSSKFLPNCKIKSSGYFGPLVWDGKDSRYTYLRELPTHATYNKGDTIVTSGFSATFPEGVPVGVVDNFSVHKSGDYNSLKVKLFTDFATLNDVLIVENSLRDEQKTIEKGE